MSAPQFTNIHRKRPSLPPPSWVLWLMRGLALAALSLAIYLSWVSLTGDSLAGACSVTGTDCNAVLVSEWSKWFNLPISLGGVLVYGGIFLVSWLFSMSRRHMFAWGTIGCLSLLAALSGIWFVILQFQMGKFCFVCLLTHACGIAIATIAWFSMPKTLRSTGEVRAHVLGTRPAKRASQPTGLQTSHLVAVAMVALLGMVSLVTGQIQSVHHTQEKLVFADDAPGGGVKPDEGTASPDSVKSDPEADESGTRTGALKRLMSVTKNKVVAFDYTLTSDDGQTVDSSEGRDLLYYLHGAGNIIGGLEQALEGKSVGEQFQVSIAPADGYGERNDALRKTVPREDFQGVEDLALGMQFRVDSNVGESVVTVVEITDDSVTIDGNHSLAGMTLNFDITVREVRDATEEELTHSHVHGPDGHEHH